MNENLSCLQPLAAGIAFVLLVILIPHRASAAKILAGDYQGLMRRSLALSAEKGIEAGDAYLSRNHPDSALVCYMVVADRLSEEMSQPELHTCALAHLKAGDVYFKMGSYANALDYYVKGLRVEEKCDIPSHAGRFNKNIGNVYCSFQNYSKGLEYYRRSLEQSKAHDDRDNSYKTLINMAWTYMNLDRPDDAYLAYLKAEKFRDADNEESSVVSTFCLGLIHMARGQHREALAIFLPLVERCSRLGSDPRYLCLTYQNIYHIYHDLGNQAEEARYMHRCLDAGREGDVMHLCISTMRDMAEYYRKKGDFVGSDRYFFLYLTHMDSIYNQREFEMVRNTQLQYDMEQTGRTITSLQSDVINRTEEVKRMRWITGGVLLVALVIAWLLVMVWRQKRLLNHSYDDLFNINRGFIASQEQMKHRLAEAQVRYARVEEENASLRGMVEMQTGEVSETETACEPEAAAARASRVSSLSEDRRLSLLEAVSGIMENTTEFCDPDFSLSRLALLVGSNNKYVSEVINDSTGKNFSNFVAEYRIRLACVRLADFKEYGNYSMKGIAESVGFRNYSTFVTVFRKITGLNLSLYQKKALSAAAD